MCHFRSFGYKLPYLTIVALKLPPSFYFLGAALFAILVIGTWRKFDKTTYLYVAIVFLVLDLIGMLALLWGYLLPVLKC